MELNKQFETPIQRLDIKLNRNDFYIKRDDLYPISFGGNKARKAILFFNELENSNSDCVVTYGSSSSNHCRVIANIAKGKNIPCYIISPEENIKITANSKLISLFGAKIVYCSLSEVSKTIEKTLNELKEQGYNPFFIEGGGHGNTGTQAYVNAYEEIVNYEDEENIYFDYIFHTSGTGTTQAGLICGKTLHNDKRKIIGISNARRNPYGGQVVLDSVNSYLKSININPITVQNIYFIDDYILDGYGSYNKDIENTIKDILFQEGIPLDTTYTGKAFWGMKEYIKKNQITGKNVLFIHTGGTPLFFDDLEEIM